MRGVASRLNSGVGPRLAVLNRQAIWSLSKFAALIWSSGEYRVFPRSPPYVRHSPFLAPDCALSGAAQNQRAKAETAAGTIRARLRINVFPRVPPVGRLRPWPAYS